jgi:hypothetical protein
MTGCQYIGPEQKNWPFTMCGCKPLAGKSYCGEHYWRVYQKGSATAGRRKEKEVEKEIQDLKRLQELDLENDDV